MTWKNRAILGLGCTEGCSQKYLGNLSPLSALIILLFTNLLDWDSPVLPSPSGRTKGFPWKWGPGSVKAVSCTERMQQPWLSYCLENLIGGIRDNDQASGTQQAYAFDVHLALHKSCFLLKALHGLRSVAGILVTFSLCFSQSLESLTWLEILCDSELTVNIFRN